MKERIHLLLFLLIVTSATMSAQQNNKPVTQTPPSDAPSGFTYNFDKTIKLIMDRMGNPNEFNSDAEAFVAAQDFPKYKNGEPIDAEMRNKIRLWMEKNPSLIINTLKHRNDIVTQF